MMMLCQSLSIFVDDGDIPKHTHKIKCGVYFISLQFISFISLATKSQLKVLHHRSPRVAGNQLSKYEPLFT